MSDTAQDSSERFTFWKHTRAAYADWQSVVGTVAAALTALNFLRHAIDFRLSEVFDRVALQYEIWVHGSIEIVFRFLRFPEPPGLAIDATIFWLVMAGIVLRTQLAIWAEGRRMIDADRLKKWGPRPQLLSWPKKLPWQRRTSSWVMSLIRLPRWKIALHALLLWPLVAIEIVANSGAKVPAISLPEMEPADLKTLAEIENATRGPPIVLQPEKLYKFHEGGVLAAQIVGLALCVLSLILADYVLKFYEV